MDNFDIILKCNEEGEFSCAVNQFADKTIEAFKKIYANFPEGELSESTVSPETSRRKRQTGPSSVGWRSTTVTPVKYQVNINFY